MNPPGFPGVGASVLSKKFETTSKVTAPLLIFACPDNAFFAPTILIYLVPSDTFIRLKSPGDALLSTIVFVEAVKSTLSL